MLRTRLWMGTALVVLVVGVLVLDQQWSPWSPFLFVLVVGLSQAACAELVGLLGTERPVHRSLCHGGLLVLGIANWIGHLPWSSGHDQEAWLWVLGVFTALILAVFLVEMAVFREPGQSLERMARSVWIIGYLGLLPSFFGPAAVVAWQRGQPRRDDGLGLGDFCAQKL